MKFSNKWLNEKEPNLYLRWGSKPKTQRQFFYWKYWQFFEKYVKSFFKNQILHAIKVLEVGCGRGTISQYLWWRTRIHQIHLLDNSEEALQIAHTNIPNGNFYKADACDMPFDRDTFDLIFSMGVVEHIENHYEFFKEQSRVLKLGGIIVCWVVPDKKSIQMLNVFGTDKYVRHPVSMESYRRAMCEAGLKPIQEMHVTPFPLFTPIPRWMEYPITLVYRFIDSIRGLFMDYSFKSSKRLCQSTFLIAQK